MGENPIMNMRSDLIKALIYSVLTLTFTVVGVNKVSASHLVGGDLTYQCLGNNKYKVVLTVRRDCGLAFPDALFDDPASIGIFDKDYNLLTDLAANGQILIPFNNDDTLNQVLINKCTVTTGDVCVHETRYEFTLTLPFRAGGYNLVYQRCCRNLSLTNTSDPLNTGMTLVSHLSEKSMELCNSSPVFKQWPAIYICNDVAIDFDHGATDGNGDSLVYRLVTPYTGATREIPRPQPPNAGPYSDIIWSSAAYSVNNMLGSVDASKTLKIDARTGRLTGTPAIIGQFVVGIEVDEYRNGELISTVRRDFQYNVRNCSQDILAQMDAPGGLCGPDRTITFKNTSLNAPFIQWFFDYPNNPSATSREENPTYTYPAEGVYTVMLIAGVQGACMDTLKRQISVFDDPLNLDLDYEPLSCSNENLQIRLLDLSSDPNGTINKWQWTIAYDGTLIVRDEESPEITVPHNKPISVTLTVESTSGCVGTFTEELIPRFIKDDISKESIIICQGDTTLIDPISGTLPAGVSIQWLSDQPNLSGNLNDRTIAFFSGSLGSVFVYFNVVNGAGCSFRDSVRIDVLYKPALNFTIDNTCGTNLVELSNLTADATNFSWFIEDKDTVFQAKTFEYVFATSGDKMITLKTSDGCAPSLSKAIFLFDSTSIFSNLNRDARGCPGDQVELNPGGDPNLIYSWSPAEFFDDPNAVNPTVTIGPATTGVMVVITHVNNPTCSLTTSFNVVNLVEDVLKNLPDTVFACPGIAVTLNPDGNDDLTYEWSPAGLFSNPSSSSPTLTTNDDVEISVRITDPANANCFAEKTIQVLIGVDAVIDALPDTVETCPGREITLNEGGSTLFTYEWSPPGLFSDANAVSPKITVDTHTVITVKVTDTNNGNCSASKDILLWIPILDAINKLPDSVVSCFGAPVNLNPEGSNRFTYQWSPEQNLDNGTAVNPLATVSTTTVFSVTISDAITDCQLTGMVRVVVPPSFELITNIDDTTLCATDSIHLTAQIDGGVGVTIEWKNPQGEVISTENEIDVKPNGTGNYTVTATDAWGCTRSQSFMLIRGTLDVSIALEPDGVICSGDEINLTVINNRPDQTLTYQWTANPSITSGLNGASITALPQDTTTYEVLVTNAEGCSKTLSLTVNVVPFALNIEAVSNPYTIDLGKTSQLNVTSGTGFTYKWDPAGTLNQDNISNPVAKPTETTIYTASVTSPEGCTGTDTTIVNVIIPECAEPFLFIPNAFTPNGDGHNDILYVRGNTIDEMELIIYNRWGEQVFRSTSQSFGWDGNFSGKVANSDVYGYYLRILCFDGNTFTKKGNISLLR